MNSTETRSLSQSQPSISVVTATAIVVANMIGTGVFTSLGFQVGDLPSGFTLLFLWVVGGVCALCGALAYGELAAALPRSGGEYHFLSAVFHPSLGFVAGWASATAGFAAPVALSAMAFGQYAQAIAPGAPAVGLSLAIVAIVTAVHITSVRVGSAFQNFFTWLKVGIILLIVGAGCLVPEAQPISFAPRQEDLGLIFSGPFAISLIYVMYSYSGWNGAAYIIGEIESPARNVPRALVGGTLLVMALYVALNFVFLHTTAMSKLAGQLEIGNIAGAQIFGPAGGRVIGAVISFLLISSVSSMTWIGPRVTMAMGEDLRPLRWLAKRTSRGIPVVAILMQQALVVVLILTATFQKALVYVQFTLILCSFLTVLGVMVLRQTHPELPRPYKTWGYPVTPIIFLGVSLWMMGFIVRSQPWESMAGLATLALGAMIYFIAPKGQSSNR